MIRRFFMNKQENNRSKINIKGSTISVAVLGILTAMCIVIAMFLTIRPNDSIKITLTFIPVVIAARLYGPAGAGIVAGLADIIGCIVNPHGMIYPPITMTEVMVGIVLGLFLYKKWNMIRIIAAVGINQLIFSTFLTPLWLFFLYGANYQTLLVVRIPQILIMITIQIILIPVILKTMDKINIKNLVRI